MTDSSSRPQMNDSPQTDRPELDWSERRRLRRLERSARREARLRRRRSGRSAGGGEPHVDLEPADLPTRQPARRRASPLARRLRRATLLGVAALLLISTAVPPFLIPVDGTVSSRFFIRNAPDSPRLFDFEHHTGLDFAAPVGTRVGASRSGRVVTAGSDPRYGLYVDVRHLFGWVTRYAHLSRIDVREGSFVWRGRRIGAVGATGRVTGPHLHFELRIAGRAYPPGLFLVFHSVRRLIVGL